jgi:hypothetical protein
MSMKKAKLKYISKRLVSSKSRSAFKEGARNAMKKNGYLIIALDGWLVKKFSDGKIEKLEALNYDKQDLELKFD